MSTAQFSIEAIHVRRVERAEPGLVPGLCALLQDSVDGGASVGFMAPLQAAEAEEYWLDVMRQVGPKLLLWVAESDGRVVGSVQLAPCMKANGRHRAELQKLAVHSDCRGHGLATRLMRAAEDAARALGLTLLVLDTLKASAAEAIYPHLGWSRAGEIPEYAASPFGGLHPTVVFYKQLG